MRVTRIPGDFNDIGSSPCIVWLNEVPVLEWSVADDFRRVVETPDGPRFGSVRIEVNPKIGDSSEEAATHMCGVFVIEPKPEASAIEIVEAEPEPVMPVVQIKQRPASHRKGRK